MNETSIIVEKINNIYSLEAIKHVWNSLLVDNDTKTTELSYEWQISFWKQFNRDSELFVLVIREAGSIIAISPLKLVTKHALGIKVRCLEIIAARTSNYQDLIIGKNSEDVLTCILDYLMNDRGSWDQLSLRHVPETSKTARFFLEKLGTRPLLRIAETEKCAFLALDRCWEEHKKNLGKHRRHRMTNNRMRIEREIGEIHLRKSATDDQLNSDLQAFFTLHQKRWSQTYTPSLFLDSRYRKFYLEAGLLLLPKGQICLYVLEAGGTPLGYMLIFAFKQSVLIQMVTYDPDYSKYSPMVALIEIFVEETLANGITEIDFGSYYPWKETWANHSKNRLNVLVFPNRFLPFIIYHLTILFKALRLRVRQHPRILIIIKTTLRRIGVLN